MYISYVRQPLGPYIVINFYKQLKTCSRHQAKMCDSEIIVQGPFIPLPKYTGESPSVVIKTQQPSNAYLFQYGI